MDAAVPAEPEVSILIPARNEEGCLGDCLASLVSQGGVKFEIIVIDDHSTDQTRRIGESFAGVRVISARPLPPGWTGKNNALVSGTQVANGKWLLFTDADTVHLPGSLARALAEVKEHQAELLSYSPEQVVGTFWEKAVMPVVFAELAAEYPPDQVRNPSSGVVAANGQYILARREAYDAIGGHAALADRILEDVALASAFRAAGYRIYFRYAADQVRTRMYRTWNELRDGWTKNLALLFPRTELRAAGVVAWWALAWITLPLPIAAIALYLRIRCSGFSRSSTLLALAFGAPVFSYLMLRSKRAHSRGQVSWKGRSYSSGSNVSEAQAASLQEVF